MGDTERQCRFSGTSEKVAALPASQMIQQTLSYAKELERIV
jgi:hypothetical protein